MRFSVRSQTSSEHGSEADHRGYLVAVAVLVARAAVGQTPSYAPPPALACHGDRVVWVNTRSRVYQYQGERYFGSTAHGRFMCETDARREGDRPTRNGQ